MKCGKKERKRRALWARGRGRFSDARPRPPRLFDDLPDNVLVGVAERVPRSRDCEGHEERMREHAERVAREDVPCCGPKLTLCFGCGKSERRKSATHGPAGTRWRVRPLKGSLTNMESYCPACFRAYGWADPPGPNAKRGA